VRPRTPAAELERLTKLAHVELATLPPLPRIAGLDRVPWVVAFRLRNYAKLKGASDAAFSNMATTAPALRGHARGDADVDVDEDEEMATEAADTGAPRSSDAANAAVAGQNM